MHAGRCPPKKDGSPGEPVEDDQMKHESFNNDSGWYGKIIFCTGFFSLRSMSEAKKACHIQVEGGPKQPGELEQSSPTAFT
jgi:hypothetical protein